MAIGDSLTVKEILRPDKPGSILMPSSWLRRTSLAGCMPSQKGFGTNNFLLQIEF
jgi:hypothetical protein